MTTTILQTLLFAIRILLPFVAIVIVHQVFSSMRNQRRSNRPLIVLFNTLTKKNIPVIYWENSIGRSKRCDIRLKNDQTLSRNHAVLFRRSEGWFISDTESKSGVYLNNKKITKATKVFINDLVTIGSCTFKIQKADCDSQTQKSWFFNEKKAVRAINSGNLLSLVSFFHLLLALSLAFKEKNPQSVCREPLICFACLFSVNWLFFFVTRFALKRTTFELETLAIFLSGTGVLLVSPNSLKEPLFQGIAMLLGFVVFCFIIWFIHDVDRVSKYRLFIAIFATVLLTVNLLFGKDINGSKNWIIIGPISVQISEFVKIAFVFAGTSTLERLQTTKNLTGFILFTAICIGALFLMRDFGTACVFFVTFVIIAFMRSGSFRTLVLSGSAAAFAAFMILKFKPYVAKRFSTWRHIWEDPQDKGYQQVQVLICSASGGLFGLGCGCGRVRSLFAGTSDLMFGLINEELGLIMALILVLSIICLAMYARTVSSLSRSSFYSIASCVAAGMLVFQATLHVLGITDILPLTGVTLPFLSLGGSSMISVWGLLAFIKASDERTYSIMEGEQK